MSEMASSSAESTDMELVTRFLLLGQVGSGHSVYAPKSSSIMASRYAEIHDVVERIIADGQGQQLLDQLGQPRLAVSRTAAAYVLASCSTNSDEHIKTSALKALPSVCPTSKELFTFIHARETLCKTSNNTTGWGRALQRAIKRWYEEKPPLDLAVECARAVVQDGWTHRDVLRLAHINSQNIGTAAVIRFVTQGLEKAEKDFGSETEATGDVIAVLKDFRLFGKSDNEHLSALLISKHSLAYDSLPTHLRTSTEVLQTIIPRMPLDELLSHLKWFAKSGLLSSRSLLLPFILERLLTTDAEQLANVHPIAVFALLKKFEDPEKKVDAAMAVVSQTDESKATVKPPSSASSIRPWILCQPAIINALKVLMTNTHKHFPVRRIRYLIAMDVRSEMYHSKVFGHGHVTAIEAAVVLMKTLNLMEPSVSVIAFSENGLTELNVGKVKTVEEIKEQLSYVQMGLVDCAQPMLWAKEKKCSYDVFMILTDGQIGIVDTNPSEALAQYRQQMALPHARVVIHALSLSHSQLIDDGPGLLYVFGMNHKVPGIVRKFVEASAMLP